MDATRRRLAVLGVAALAGLAMHGRAAGGSPWPVSLTARALAAGVDAELPAHLSVVLGLTLREQRTPVRQLVARTGDQVHTFNVCPGDHPRRVILTADERTRTTTAYLITARGALHKAVTYQPGQPAEILAGERARAGFAVERRFWSQWSPP